MSFLYAPADLHVHTVLSPCAELEMIPPLIIERALELGLGFIAVCDHNATGNTPAMVEAGRQVGLCVLPGMEVQSREEVHILCLFDTLEQAAAWQAVVDAHLPALPNRDDVFGSQLIVDAWGEFVAFEERLLLTSTSLSVEEIFSGVHRLGGLALPAHVDRPSYSLLANLGFLPPGLDIIAVEISRQITPAEARKRFPQLAGVALIGSGDAHRLEEMTHRTMFKVASPTVEEIKLACLGSDGRKVWVE